MRGRGKRRRGRDRKTKRKFGPEGQNAVKNLFFILILFYFLTNENDKSSYSVQWCKKPVDIFNLWGPAMMGPFSPLLDTFSLRPTVKFVFQDKLKPRDEEREIEESEEAEKCKRGRKRGERGGREGEEQEAD